VRKPHHKKKRLVLIAIVKLSCNRPPAIRAFRDSTRFVDSG
jgi:hypothetical protein